jgi:hypothetical protein
MLPSIQNDGSYLTTSRIGVAIVFLIIEIDFEECVS